MKFYTKEDLRDSRLFFDKNPANYLRYFSYFLILICLSAVIGSQFLIKNYIVKGSGTVESADKRYVTPLVNGDIVSIEIKEGAEVKAGETLLKISTGTDGVETSEMNKQIEKLEAKKVIFDKYQNSLSNKQNLLANGGAEQEYFGKVEYYLSQVKDDAKNGSKNQVDIEKKQAELSTLKTELETINTTANKEYQKNYGRKSEDLQNAQSKLDSLNQELNNLKNKLNSKKDEEKESVQSEINAKQIEIESQITTITAIKRELEDVFDTADSDLRDKLKTKQSEIDAKNQEIEDLKNQSSKQSESTFQQLISELGTARTANDDKITELKAQKNVKSSSDTLTNLTADKDGTVHYLSLIKSGLGVQALQPIAQITNSDDKNLMVEAYISAQDRTKIKLKDNVKVSVNGVNTSKYGLLQGTVKSISDGTITQTVGNEQQIFYQVNITLKNQTLSSKNDRIKVEASMPITADIVYEKETYWDWLMKQLNFKQ